MSENMVKYLGYAFKVPVLFSYQPKDIKFTMM